MIEVTATELDRGMVHSSTGHLAIDVYHAAGKVFVTWVDMFDNEYVDVYNYWTTVIVDPESDR